MDLTNTDITRTHELISDAALKETPCRLFPEGTVLVAMYGGFKQIGRTGLLTRRSAINQAISAIDLDREIAYPTYVLYWLNAHVSIWRSFAASSRKDPNITREDVCSFPIHLPPIGEQKYIAAILRTWDEAIATTEKLIVNGLKQRRALTRQLLSGRKRLPGFSNKWHQHRLGELFAERIQTGYDDLPLLSITREEGVIHRDEVGRKDTSNEDKSKYLRICRGDIGYNTMRMWQGVSALSELEGIVSPAYTIVTPNGSIDGRYAANLFKFPPVIFMFYRHSQGLVSDTWNLKYPQFAEIKVTIPDRREQEAISRVLATADEQIRAQTSTLEMLREERRSLMQQLLTGRRRLRITKSAEPASALA